MVVRRKYKILFTVLGLVLVGSIITWLINLSSRRSTPENATLQTLNNDLLVYFRNDQSSGSNRQIICRNGKVGIEQIAIGYVLTDILDTQALNNITQTLGQDPFYFSRSDKAVGDSQDGFKEFTYYGTKPGRVDIKNVSDFKGNAQTINEQKFLELYNQSAQLFKPLLLDTNGLAGLVDSLRFHFEREHDFRVIGWPFAEIQFKDGLPSYADSLDYVVIPSGLQDQVHNLYSQTDNNILYAVTDYGVFRTFITENTRINYSPITEWDENFLGFIPTEANEINRYDLLNPSQELLDKVKNKTFQKGTYYYKSPDTGNMTVYNVRANPWYGSLKQLGDFCTE